jgi:hypothetical protein
MGRYRLTSYGCVFLRAYESQAVVSMLHALKNCRNGIGTARNCASFCTDQAYLSALQVACILTECCVTAGVCQTGAAGQYGSSR